MPAVARPVGRPRFARLGPGTIRSNGPLALVSAPFSWIRPETWGIHLVPADAWIDPARQVDRALVTHGHADHARRGHARTVATPETLAIMALRYRTGEGPDAGDAVPAGYGETISLAGAVRATLMPAGHVLGSAQILLEYAGERVVVTEDYKRRPDPTCSPFEVTPCDAVITEATFGLPLFTHPPIALNERWSRRLPDPVTAMASGWMRETDRSLVFEVASDSVHESRRHKSGLAMRFPRTHRVRWDKPPHEADRIDTLRALIRD